MPKIKIKADIRTKDDKTTTEATAIIQEDILKYQENDKTKVILNLEDKTLIRENDSIKMNFSFNTNKGLIEVKEYNKIIDIDIKVKEIERKGNDIKIVYQIDQDEFIYQVGEVK